MEIEKIWFFLNFLKKTPKYRYSTFQKTYDFVNIALLKKNTFLFAQFFRLLILEPVFKGIVKWQGRGGVSGVIRTVMTSHTISDVF